MLVCNVSLRPPRSAIAADVAELAAAVDATATGNVVFATLVDDPASVGDIVDAYLGEIMLEAASAADTTSAGSAYAGAVDEAASATDTQSATVPALGPPLDTVSSVTGAWSLSRDMLTAFAGGTRYTKTGTAIITLEDQSGNNRDFTDAGFVQRRPTETTAFPASVLCADFSGVSTMTMANVALSNFISASSGAVVVSVIVDAISSNVTPSYSNDAIIADGSVYMGLYARNLSGVTFYAFNWDGSEDAPATPGAVGTAYVLMWRHDGGNIYVSVNGGTEVSVASGNTQVLTGLLLLGGNAAGSACNCKIAEAFATSNGSQTAALATAIANMKSYIGA
jgi:hypothetical protein